MASRAWCRLARRQVSVSSHSEGRAEASAVWASGCVPRFGPVIMWRGMEGHIYDEAPLEHIVPPAPLILTSSTDALRLVTAGHLVGPLLQAVPIGSGLRWRRLTGSIAPALSPSWLVSPGRPRGEVDRSYGCSGWRRYRIAVPSGRLNRAPPFEDGVARAGASPAGPAPAATTPSTPWDLTVLGRASAFPFEVKTNHSPIDGLSCGESSPSGPVHP